MYQAKIVTDSGKTFRFSYENDVVFDISPLSGFNVTLSTSQAFGQIGETVENVSVKGVTRTITGKVLTERAAQSMLSTLTAYTHGKLYFNDMYWCPVTIKNTPTIVHRKNGSMPFTMQVYCEVPFWYSTESKHVSLNTIRPTFNFPVVYDTHKFGERTSVSAANVFNSGDVSAPFDLIITSSGAATNYGIINTRTGANLTFTDTISSGDQVHFYRKNDRAIAEKTSGGVTTGALAYLTDDSDLFSLEAGDNLIMVTAEDGAASVSAHITFNAAYMGVIP